MAHAFRELGAEDGVGEVGLLGDTGDDLEVAARLGGGDTVVKGGRGEARSRRAAIPGFEPVPCGRRYFSRRKIGVITGCCGVCGGGGWRSFRDHARGSLREGRRIDTGRNRRWIRSDRSRASVAVPRAEAPPFTPIRSQTGTRALSPTLGHGARRITRPDGRRDEKRGDTARRRDSSDVESIPDGRAGPHRRPARRAGRRPANYPTSGKMGANSVQWRHRQRRTFYSPDGGEALDGTELGAEAGGGRAHVGAADGNLGRGGRADGGGAEIAAIASFECTTTQRGTWSRLKYCSSASWRGESKLVCAPWSV